MLVYWGQLSGRLTGLTGRGRGESSEITMQRETEKLGAEKMHGGGGEIQSGGPECLNYIAKSLWEKGSPTSGLGMLAMSYNR